AAARDHLARAAVVPIDAGRDRIAVIAPPEIGGIFMFRPPDAGPFLFE
ncbi:MAG: hypothetical protein HY057_10550, partial [Rhodospirillales bacterium]|nr:hypothetical protein [Rhodospirillales bacterium]